MYRSLFFTALQPASVLKKETPVQVFSCEHYELFRDTRFVEHLRTTASKLATFRRNAATWNQ